MKEGGISGMNGVIVGWRGFTGWRAFRSSGRRSGYLLDPAASHSVLEAMSRILEMKIDMTSSKSGPKRLSRSSARCSG